MDNEPLKSQNTSKLTYDQLLVMSSCMPICAVAVTKDIQTFCVNNCLTDLLEKYNIPQSTVLSEIFGEIHKNAMVLALHELNTQASVQIPIKFNEQVYVFSISRMGKSIDDPILITGQDVSQYEKQIDSVREEVKSLEADLEEQNVDLSQARDRAMAANRAKSGFLANMSHELRTPLNAIIGYSEIIHDNAQDHDFKTIPSDAEKITKAGHHLLSLINNVLDLSKIEAGKENVFVEDINLHHLLVEIKGSTETLITKNKNSFEFTIPNDLRIIKTDITKLRQILFNIIGNAAKFTENGRVAVTAVEHSDNINISISDTGIGMSKEQLTDLTTPFMQGDISTTRKYGGTGLGMSLTEHLANILGIKIEVESTLAKGTCFNLIIPFQYDELKQAV